MVTDFATLAAACAPNIHPVTLQAVVNHESNANVFAIGINGSKKLDRQPRNRAEAIATATWLAAHGYNFDAGLGQINIKNLSRLGMTIADLFDPCKNLAGAANVLSDCYERALYRYAEGQPALRAALSCYNTGNFVRGFKNGYVAKVTKKVGEKARPFVPALEPMAVSLDTAPVQIKTVRYFKSSRIASNQKDATSDIFTENAGDAFSAKEVQ